MKNTTLLIIIVLIVIGGGYFLIKAESASSNATSGSINGETQKITISMKNNNYYPNTITVKAGQPVEITLDNSVSGCYRSFTINSLGVYKTSRNPSDKIVFTPTKAGTYPFACSMNMGRGTLIVE